MFNRYVNGAIYSFKLFLITEERKFLYLGAEFLRNLTNNSPNNSLNNSP